MGANVDDVCLKIYEITSSYIYKDTHAPNRTEPNRTVETIQGYK